MSESTSKPPGQIVVARAAKALQYGDPVLIHDFDDREDETDIIYPATSVTPADVARLRNDAGGLICVALSNEVAKTFELPFLSDVISHPCAESQDLAYDERSSFSLTVNHRDTNTGIPDNERAHTITAIGDAAGNPYSYDFTSEFRAPGHVHLLKAAQGGISQRHGHTELSLRLANEANCTPATVVCEMLDDETGEALSGEKARHYAQKKGLVFVEGSDLLRRFL